MTEHKIILCFIAVFVLLSSIDAELYLCLSFPQPLYHEFAEVSNGMSTGFWLKALKLERVLNKRFA